MSSLECKVCLQEYSSEVEELTPRMLTCGHTICEKCAEQILEGDEVACPFDRKITNVDGGEIKALSKNYTLLEVLEERQTGEEFDDELSGDEVEIENEEVKVPCSENSDHAAVFYCEECESDLCDECSTLIHAPKTLCGHNRIPVSEKPNSAPKCILHPDYLVDFHCIEPGCQSELKEICIMCLVSGKHDSHEKRYFESQRLERLVDVKILLLRFKLAMAHLREEINKSEVRTESYDKTGPRFQAYSSFISDKCNEKKTMALSELGKICDRNRVHFEKMKKYADDQARTFNKLKECYYGVLKLNTFYLNAYKDARDYELTVTEVEDNYKTLDDLHLSDSFELVSD